MYVEKLNNSSKITRKKRSEGTDRRQKGREKHPQDKNSSGYTRFRYVEEKRTGWYVAGRVLARRDGTLEILLRYSPEIYNEG